MARFANEIERVVGGRGEGFGPTGALPLPFARHFEDGENDLREHQQDHERVRTRLEPGPKGTHTPRKGMNCILKALTVRAPALACRLRLV